MSEKKAPDKQLLNYLKENKNNCTVTIDRPIGYNHHGKIYPINYGYIKGLIGGDGEDQDVYVLGVTKPIKLFKGKLIARIIRDDDNEEKWVACPKTKSFSKDEIEKATHFMEQYFKSHIIML